MARRRQWPAVVAAGASRRLGSRRARQGEFYCGGGDRGLCGGVGAPARSGLPAGAAAPLIVPDR
jgi:hypothetical protein